MRYIRPTSLTWWAGLLAMLTGIGSMTLPAVAPLSELARLVALLAGSGDETQGPDPFIAAKMGTANTPAWRGAAYVVFEELALERFGNRLPQLNFEVFRPLADPDAADGLV